MMQESEVVRRFLDAIQEPLTVALYKNRSGSRGLWVVDLTSLPSLEHFDEATVPIEVAFVPLSEVDSRIALSPMRSDPFFLGLQQALRSYRIYSQAVVLVRVREMPRVYRIVELGGGETVEPV